MKCSEILENIGTRKIRIVVERVIVLWYNITMKGHYEVFDPAGDVPVVVEFEDREKAIAFCKEKNCSFVQFVRGDFTTTEWINEDVFYRP